jgi:hypothetical protein
MESFSKIVAILISVLLLFIAPLMYMAQKQDMISQIYVSNETTKFIDSIKNTGVLSSDMYDAFIRRLAATNISYRISLTHGHKKVEPLYDDVSSTFTENYVTYYYNTYEKSIRKELEDKGEYLFSQGDYISIEVINQSMTLGTKIQRMIFNTSIPKEQIVVTYGGLIRSETN